MSQLSNRVYYLRTQWAATVGPVVQYATLELQWRYSPLRLRAFALRKHERLVQSLLCLWVFFVIQISLEHLGTDYTFIFQWIRHDKPPRDDDRPEHS